MNFAAIKYHDIANGPGVRVSLFVSGCTHHCPGCFNPETWEFSYGDPFTPEVENKIIEALTPDHIKGFTLLGGEPLEPVNQQALLPFLRRLRIAHPDKSVWCYTGCTFEEIKEQLPNHPETEELLSLIDILVDGLFVEAEKDITLRFRGSSNQRIIRLQPSLASGEIVLWDDSVQIINRRSQPETGDRAQESAQ